jgi:hypothetical protein
MKIVVSAYVYYYTPEKVTAYALGFHFLGLVVNNLGR